MALDESAVAELRKGFPSLHQTVGDRPIVFFDGPGGTQVHRSVIRAMGRYLIEANSNQGGAFAYSRRTDDVTTAARVAMADFLNAARPEEIVFGPNMTSLTFALSRAVGRLISPGDEVIVTRLDHDANVAPWVALAERGAIIREVDFDPGDCTLDWPSLYSAVNARTRLLALGYASNAVGTINDVQQAARLAHSVGAWLFVDAVHFAPHGPIDVQAIGCDFLACSAYKFFGPHLGVLYGRHELLESLPACKVRPARDEPPHKFETGTQSFEALAGATAAVEYLAGVGRRFGGEFEAHYSCLRGRRQQLKTAMAAIRVYEQKLCLRLLGGLKEIPGLRLYGITSPERVYERVPTVSFTADALTPRQLAERLDHAGIAAWDGDFYAPAVTRRLGLDERGGLLRVGLVHYNTAQEVDGLLEVLGAMPLRRHGALAAPTRS